MSTLAASNLKNASSGSNNIVLNSDGTTTIAAPSNIIKSGTAVASTSGTAIDFTGIPSWVKRVTVMFNGVSTNGTNSPIIQIGSGSIDATSYLNSTSFVSSAVTTTSITSGWAITPTGGTAAATVMHGAAFIAFVSSNTWVVSGSFAKSDSAATCVFAGSKALSGALDRIRITTVSGTDTFDAGTINILWEG